MQVNWLALLTFCLLTPISLCAGSIASAGERLGLTLRQRAILYEMEDFATPDGGQNPGWLLRAWDTDKGLADLVALPRGSENAAACFRLLEDYYPDEKAELAEGGADSRGVRELLLAADMGRCTFVPDYYPAYERTDAKQPDLDALNSYLQALLRRAEAEAQAGRYAEAERCYRAALVCGWHLTSDKSTGLIFVTGLIFKIRGAQGYAVFLLRSGNREKGEAALAYARLLAELMRAFTWKTNVALSEFDGFACLPSTVRIATTDSEAFWRAEAVLRLGTLRYGIPDDNGGMGRNPAFELAADEALSTVANTDANPSVRRLALWVALNVSPKDYSALRHRFAQLVGSPGKP